MLKDSCSWEGDCNQLSFCQQGTTKMKNVIRICILLFAMWPAFLLAEQCLGTASISDPEKFQWTNEGDHFSGTMEIAEADLVIGGETITTRVYRQEGGCDSIPGPTIHMTPGNTYVLKFRNRLPYEAPEAAHNVFKDPNVSNLHTHGLHISGETPGDDVTRSFEGGAGGDFVYEILPDHMGGTFWYHAHHHGSTFLQVSGGAFGLIIIDDSADGIPASVASMTERPLVIGYLDPDAAGTGGDTLITGTLSPTWTVNGHVNGDLIMPPNTWEHFRILLADRDAIPDTVSIGANCEVALMARDGVWRTEAPLVLADNSIKITGASRADLAVRCSGESSISVGGTQVARIVVDGTANPTPSPYDTSIGETATWSVVRPHYLRDLRNETVGNTESVNMGARTINGSKYDGEVPTFRLNADQQTGLQRWQLKGARNHPFHLHIYHVQIDGSCADYEDGEYYDVVANNCAIRFDLDSTHPDATVYEGRTIMHCHILEHEDQGAMGWTDVVGGMGPPTFPAGHGYTDYIDPVIPGGNPPSAPDNLTAIAASSSQIDLSWNDNSNDETTFDIEISANGTDFTFIDFVSADTTSYSDTGLAESSTWFYRVQASNTHGSSPYSNTASATTLSGGSPTSVQVDTVTVSTSGIGGGQKIGRATVVITDDLGGLVEGADVHGEFSGDISSVTLIGTTDATGSTVIESTDSAKGKVNLTFCVTSVSSNDAGLADYAGAPVCDSL
jgi:FtsP/CotA-like multicopper oxidase with cupredoxin domain